MVNLRHILVAILVYSVCTVWVRERWALSGLQTAVFLCAAVLAVGVVLGRRRVRPRMLVALCACVCAWGAIQLAAHWTVVRSATADSVLYWLTAACLVWLGEEAFEPHDERRKFLQAALTAGTAIAIVGILQMFTSNGRILWLFPSGYQNLVIGPFVYPNNYAEFVELLVPVALTLACTSRNSTRYLLAAAALLATVVAAGSRAGSVLVVVEAAAVFLLTPSLAGKAVKGSWRRWSIFAITASVFILIVGYQYLWEKTSQSKDPYMIRREFLESSIAMVRAEPFHGFGLGTWPSAYRSFATIDTGLIANHAHNEWVQWAAEGGLPVFLFVFAIFGLCLPAAVRSPWGIGVIAVFLHSAVDYPFLRLGLAAWIFVLIGALAASTRKRRFLPTAKTGWPQRAVAGMAVLVLVFAAFYSARLAWADVLFRRGAPDDVRRASLLRPDSAECQIELARLDPASSLVHLERGLALNPFLTAARIELAGDWEDRGQLNRAEADLLEAARRDHQFAAPWALANFYFRNNRPDGFWYWARKAAGVSYGNLTALFDLCFLLTDNAQIVLDRVVIANRPVEHQLLTYLLEHQRVDDARVVANRISAAPLPADREALLTYVDRAITAGHTTEARDVWNAMCRRRLLTYDPKQSVGIVNGTFSHPILGRGFDWHVASGGGITAAELSEGGPALEVIFSGKEPEACEFLAQPVPLHKGAEYILQFEYRTADLPETTGLFWTIGPGKEFPLAGSDNWVTAAWRFTPPADSTRLVLAYRRAIGTTRIEGALSLRRVRISNHW